MNNESFSPAPFESAGQCDGPATERWVDTDLYGRVIDASPEGARLFNLTVRGIMGRNLSLFFTCRQLIADGLQVLRGGYSECPVLETEYRPMERKRRRLRVKMGSTDRDAVRWTFSEGLGDADARAEPA